MPHISIEYSQNLETGIDGAIRGKVDIAGLCEALRAAAAAHDALPMPGVRVRAYAARHCAIADGNPQHGFIDITVRMREGRPPEVKQDAAQTLFAAARNFLDPALATRSLALSLEVRDISADYAPKTGTIRDYLGNDT